MMMTMFIFYQLGGVLLWFPAWIFCLSMTSEKLWKSSLHFCTRHACVFVPVSGKCSSFDSNQVLVRVRACLSRAGSFPALFRSFCPRA